jgi:hypothetical protein
MTIRDYDEALDLWRSLPAIGWDDASDSEPGIAAFLLQTKSPRFRRFVVAP